MKKKLLCVLVAVFLVAGLLAVSVAAGNITGNDNICHLSGPNPDCPNPDCPNPDCPDPDCPDPDCPNPDCPHNGPNYRGGK